MLIFLAPYVSRDQKLVWDLIDKLDFSCSPVFQLYNTARGLVVETFFTFLVDVESKSFILIFLLCLGFVIMDNITLYF